MDPDVLRAPGTMEADASVLADVLPTESLSASGRPLGPLREELYRIPDLENVGHVVGVWVQSLGVLLLAAWVALFATTLIPRVHAWISDSCLGDPNAFLFFQDKLPVGRCSKSLFDWMKTHLTAIFDVISFVLESLIGGGSDALLLAP